MNFSTDVSDQVKHLPDWVMVMIGLTLLSLYWKKSQLPNKPLKYLNLILPTIAYPILHYTAEADQRYWNPWAMLGLHGLFIGIATEFCHEGIITKIKSVFPSVKFPEEVETKAVVVVSEKQTTATE